MKIRPKKSLEMKLTVSEFDDTRSETEACSKQTPQKTHQKKRIN